MADSYTPPASVAANARRALDVRKAKPPSERGMTPIGIARATQLANRTPVSLSTIQRMASYFARHEVDKEGSTWDEQGKGWQAWMGWGGDEGRTWAHSILAKQEQKMTTSTKAGSRHSAADQELIAKGYGHAKSMMETMVQLGHAVPDPDPTKAVKVLTPEGLSPRQDAMVASYQNIVSQYGKFTMGISESGANYCVESPWDDQGLICANCAFYQQGGACNLVMGAINPAGVCKLFVIQERTLALSVLEPEPIDIDDIENPMHAEAEELMDEYMYKAAADRNTTPKEREAMPAGDFVFPETRNFPIVTPSDISAAVSSWGRYGGTESFDTFKQNLIALAKRKGQNFVDALPQAWLDEMTKKAIDTPLTIEVGDDVKALARRLLGVKS